MAPLVILMISEALGVQLMRLLDEDMEEDWTDVFLVLLTTFNFLEALSAAGTFR
jgi:hypothetical protein